jgi:molecular chaperone GrpE
MSDEGFNTSSEVDPRQAPDGTSQRVVSSTELELEAARKRINELTRAWQALDRDRDDFKQRLTREREQLIDVERGTVALALLEAIDGLDLCLKSSDGSALAKGVALIRGDLLKRVDALGIERLELVGLPYDPNVAEAGDLEVTPDKRQDGLVTEELRAGYRLKNRIIRPARVRVARYVAPARA